MNSYFRHEKETIVLELHQDAFSRYSAKIVRIRDVDNECAWCESIIVNICNGQTEVYNGIDCFGGRTLVLSKEIDVDEMIEMSEGEILVYMRNFLIENYLGQEDSLSAESD